MMIVQCPSCGRKYKFPDEKIKPEGTKLKCPHCGHVFIVYPPDKQKTEKTSKKSGYVIKTPDGIELGPYQIDDVKELIKKGEILGDEEVSINGGKFVPISAVEELKSLLGANKVEDQTEGNDDDLFGDLDFGDESTSSTMPTSTEEHTTESFDEDLFGEDLDFDTSTSGGNEEEDKDLFGEISADDLEKGHEDVDSGLFGEEAEQESFSDEDVFGDEEHIGEEDKGVEEGLWSEDEEDLESVGELGSEEEEAKEEDFSEPFEEDLDSDENLAEEVSEEEINNIESSEEISVPGDEEESGFLEESFAEGEEETGEEKVEKKSKFRIGLIAVVVVLIAILGFFAVLLFVPDLSNSPGFIGKAGLLVQKTFHTRFYQQKELEEIRKSIYNQIKDRNSVELLSSIKTIETFLESTDLENAKSILSPVLMELYLELYDYTSQNSYKEKLIGLFKTIRKNLSSYQLAYYYYLMEKFDKAWDLIKDKSNNSQKVRLLKGKIARALGDYDEAEKLLSPKDFSSLYSFLAWREIGILKELEKKLLDAYRAYLSGIKANPNFLYNYMNLLLLLTSGNFEKDIPQRILLLLNRKLKKIAIPDEQAKVHYLLSLYYYQRHNDSQGLREINKALVIDKNNPQYLLLKGKLFYDQGRLVDAFLALQKALEKDPHSAETLLFLGMTTEGLKKPDKAESYYKKALKLNPDYSEAYIRLSNLYVKNKKYDKAIKLLNKAMGTLSNDVNILLQMGKIYILEKNLPKATFYLKKASSIAPGNIDVLLSFSELLVYKGKYREALSKINDVIKYHPYNDKAYYLRGLAYYNLGQYKKAAEDFKKAKIINQKEASYFLMYGKALYKIGKYDKAISNLDKALDLNINLDEAYFYKALSYFKMGSYFQAEDSIKKAIDLAENNAVYHYYLGLIYEKEDRSGYAFGEFKKAVQLDEKYVPALLKLGEYYFNLADFDEAIDTYTKLLTISKGKQKSEAYFLLGKTYLASGEPEKAYELLKKAILGGYRTSQAYTAIGEAMESLGMEDSAKEMYKKAVKADFKNPIPHYKLGMIYKEEGNFALAKRELKYALKYNPPKDIKGEIERTLRIISISSP